MSFFTDIYFPQLDHFAHKDIFQNIEQVWDPLKNCERLVRTALSKDESGDSLESLPGLTVDSSPSVRGIVVEQWIKLKNPIISKTLGIRIGSGTTLEPSA
ncbi:MAG TPA: hypothetical protein DCM60_04295, partial [Nitrospina sp.]|nr:hypothetical protein [Nitrospina sp.]